MEQDATETVRRENPLVREMIRLGIVSQEQVMIARSVANGRPDDDGSVDIIRSLIAHGFCSEDDVRRTRESYLGIPTVRLAELELDPAVMDLIPADLAYRHQVLPLKITDNTLSLAMADPLDLEALDDVRVVTGLAVEPVMAHGDEIRRHVENYYMRTMMESVEGEDIEVLREAEDDIGDLARMARETLVVKAVNLILKQAVEEGASDIHIEPFERDMKVRLRIDGVLHDVAPPAKRLQSAVISRIKIMAGMDIAERRLPQDGRIGLRISGHEIDLRVSTIPTLFGESVAMRILDKSSVMLGLDELGMQERHLRIFSRLIRLPHGMILVTGPTGSGKTTTLYGALRATFSTEKKVITIEEPVEYQLDGVNQIEVRPKIGLTFATGLRHIVRQDPDIIMVGEIRDYETADIAIHSALTGHLVFSTLHTNDAAGAVTRLIDMGVEPFLVASTIRGVVAQRLVRLVCPHCREPATVDLAAYPQLEGLAEALDGRTMYRGRGCEECKYTGYRGRTGIFEVLVPSPRIETLIVGRASTSEIKAAAMAEGMQTLTQDGISKVAAGLSTLEEVLRVTQEDRNESSIGR